MHKKTRIIVSSLVMFLVILVVNSSLGWFTFWLFQGKDFYSLFSRVILTIFIVASTVGQLYLLSLIHLKLWRKAAIIISHES